ncbi:MAG: restriction endonuclease subunit S [Selenomonas sp.]|nr:restriction endonuclease subunit S [Selenomonas sp.]
MLRLSDRAWGVFFLSDIFTIQSGTRLTKSDMRSGKMPFIGATESNNGITNWTSTVMT